MILNRVINKDLKYKVKEAIFIIRKHAPVGEIYYLAYSGGKDSDVLLHIVRRSGVNFKAIHNFTSIAHIEQRRHVAKQKNVSVIKPKQTFYQLVEKKGLPTRFRRWCCGVLKHDFGKGKITMTGVRKAESSNRKKRAKEYIEYGAKGKAKMIRSVLPLLNFTDKDIWEYIAINKIDVCELYQQGYKRVGCVGCPLATKKQRERDFKHSPGVKKGIEKSFEKYMNNNKLKESSTVKETFKNGKNGVNWWLSGLSIKEWQFNNTKPSFDFKEEENDK